MIFGSHCMQNQRYLPGTLYMIFVEIESPVQIFFILLVITRLLCILDIWPLHILEYEKDVCVFTCNAFIHNKFLSLNMEEKDRGNCWWPNRILAMLCEVGKDFWICVFIMWMGHHLFKCTTAIKPSCFFVLVFESWLSLENQSCDMLSHVQFDITDMPYFLSSRVCQHFPYSILLLVYCEIFLYHPYFWLCYIVLF